MPLPLPRPLALIPFLAAVPMLAAQAPPGVSPAADTLHGTVIPDPFRFLEADAPAARAWVQERDRRARAFAAGSAHRAEFERAIGLIAARRIAAPPIRRGAAEFLAVRTANGPGSASDLFVRSAGSAGLGRSLVSGDEARRGTGRYVPSPDGRLVAVVASEQGSNWGMLSVLRVADGRALPDTVRGLYRTQGGVVWSADGHGVFYHQSLPAGTAVRAGAVRYHPLGGDPAADREVFRPDSDANVTVSLALSPGGRHLVVLQTDGNTTEVAIHVGAAPDGPVRRIAAPAGAYAFAGELGGSLYFISWAGTPNGRLVALDDPGGRAAWREVVPTTDVINTWPGAGAAVLGGRILVAYSIGGDLVPRLFRPDGTLERTIDLPTRGSVWSGFVGSPSEPTAYYQITGLADAGTVYRLDLDTGRSTVDLAGNVVPAEVITERVWIPTAGKPIPVDVVRRRDVRLDGTAPLIMYGYGFGGWIAAPWFQPGMAVWVERGGIWAVAGVRGGGEHGESWRAEGSRRHKQRGIDDFVAATEWLIGHRYTAADRMVSNASSAGAPLVAAAEMQRPDL
ncbi:MAG: prolyl oligopeptidase family serine peptidase [Gemmatimonadales bacterium]